MTELDRQVEEYKARVDRGDTVSRSDAIWLLNELIYERDHSPASPRPVPTASQEPPAIALLRRIRAWDDLQRRGDGPYWIREIDRVLTNGEGDTVAVSATDLRFPDEAEGEVAVPTAEPLDLLANAAKGLANALPDIVLESLREEWGNTNIAVIKHWRDAVYARLRAAGAVAPPQENIQHELNAWRELGEEMGRVVSLMPNDLFDDWFPDWFGPRLFDLQVRALPPAPPQEPPQ